MTYEDLIGKTLTSVALDGGADCITFRFADGVCRTFGVEGDCCSHSWIEHLTVPDDVAGATLTDVIDGGVIESVDNHPEHDCLRVYEHRFRTNRGDIVLEYRNSSNGYYGGYLVDVAE